MCTVPVASFIDGVGVVIMMICIFCCDRVSSSCIIYIWHVELWEMYVALLNMLEQLNHKLNAQNEGVSDMEIPFTETNPRSDSTSIFTYDVNNVTTARHPARVCVGDRSDLLVDQFQIYLSDGIMDIVIGCSDGFLLASFRSVKYTLPFVNAVTSCDSSIVIGFLDNFKTGLTRQNRSSYGTNIINWIAESSCLQRLSVNGSMMVLELSLITCTQMVPPLYITFEIS